MALLLDNNCAHEGILLSLDSHKSVPAPFLTKTYQLVDDPSTDHIVSWGEDDSTFIVWRPPEFARDLLPNYFKHNNFSSFVRQLNTYGFRKIVPDRWEFANDYFKKGEKHLLCEIHRRKTSHPQVSINHLHHHQNGQGFYQFPNRISISPDSDDQQQQAAAAAAAANNWCDSPSLTSTPPGYNGGNAITALSEDNERLRRSNTMLMTELSHMRKLYNDIIYFVQNHVRPVAPSNSYPSSLVLTSSTTTQNNPPSIQNQKPQLGFYSNNQSLQYQQKQQQQQQQAQATQHPHHHQQQQQQQQQQRSVLPMLEEHTGCNRTKLFGVSLQSKKRLHPEPTSPPPSSNMMINNKARFVLGKDDLGLNL